MATELKACTHIAQTFLGQSVEIGDEVVYIKNIRTGSSTTRKCKCIGVVREIKKQAVSIDCLYVEGNCYFSDDKYHKIVDNEIICVLKKTPYWEWRSERGF